METKLVLQLNEIIRQIVRDEFNLLLSELPINKDKVDQKLPFESYIPSKIGWLKGEPQLLKLFELLSTHGYISCEYELFKSHFYGSIVKTENVRWQTHTIKLVYFFNQLMENHFIPENTKPHQLLKEHFIDMRGKNLNNATLRTLLNEVRNNKSIKVIENIIAELNKIKA